jgi:hexosaminidase
MHLIPYPSGTVQLFDGVCRLPDRIAIKNEGFQDWCITAFLTRTGVQVGQSGFTVFLRRDDTLPAEAYRLRIQPESITVTAHSEQGVIWALTTAVHLLQNGRLPCCEIEDRPRYPHRGVLLDCARHFFPVETVKRVVEGMSLAKLNVLHWHLSDDQGWRIESKRFPKLHEVSGAFYTQQEVQELVEYARNRGVEVVPELDMPGHTTGILAAYPAYSCTEKQVSPASTGGIYPTVLCPGKEETFHFLEELLDEIIPLFPGPRFHIGGDEAPKINWAACPHCRARMRAEGLTELSDLQGYFTRRVQSILKKHGKQAVCWNETLLAANAPEDVQIQYWTLQHRRAMEPFLRRGGQWIYSDMFELYLDYPYSMTSLKKVYHTIPHLGKAPCSQKDGLMGMECCIWTEHITDSKTLEQMLFPRAWAMAELCWSGTRSDRDFEERLSAMLSERLASAVHVAPKESWNPKGKARRQEALAYFKNMNAGMSEDVRKQTVQSTNPNREFARSFMRKFFQVSDLPFLLGAMKKSKERI